MTRDVPFDEEVAERDPEAQENFANVRPAGEVEARRATWGRMFDDAIAAVRVLTPDGPRTMTVHPEGNATYRLVFR